MDSQPKTRRETKKNPREKARGKTIYSSKHIRLTDRVRNQSN